MMSVRFCPLYLLLLLPFLGTPAGAGPVRVSAGALAATLDPARGGALTALEYTARKVSFLEGEAGPLWQVTFRDAGKHDVRLGPDGTTTVSTAGAQTRLVWQHLRLGAGTATVTVTVSPWQDPSLSQWRLAVEWTDPGMTLWQVDFPRITGMRKVADDDAITFPTYWGRLAKDPLRVLPRYQVSYPVPASMQYVSYYGGGAGLYLATYDADCWMKQYLWQADTKKASGDLSVLHFPPVPQPRRRWEIPYPVILGAFEGDWNDSARVYRAWALKQKWCAGGPIATRKDVPAGFKDVALWLKYYNEPGKVLGELVDHYRYLRVPMAVHYYRSPIAKFDDNYPEMLPAKPGYLQGVRDMQALGARVIPYTQGSVWDMDTESWRREGGAEAAAKMENGGFYEWPIAENTFAWMCPFTRTWQRKVVDFVAKQTWDYGLDGVYLDVLSAGAVHPCYDARHGHAIHGGNYWGEGNRVLLRGLRDQIRRRKPEAVFTTEEICETYLDGLDGFLTLDVTRGGYTGAVGLCPLFTAVYHDYTIQYGSDCALGTPTDTFCSQLAEHLVWGAKPTLSESAVPPIESKPESAAYLREATRCSVAARKYLLEGQWLRPPALDVPARPMTVGFPHKATVQMPVVRHSLWQAPDGNLGLLLTNWTGEEQRISLALDLDAHALPAGTWYWRQLWPSGAGAGLPVSGRRRLLTRTLAPRTVLFYELTRETGAAPVRAADTDFPFLFLRRGKDGAWPALKVPPGTLWYTEGAGLEIAADGSVTIRDARADQDFLLLRRHVVTLLPAVAVRVADASPGGLVVSVAGTGPLALSGTSGLQVIARAASGTSNPAAATPGAPGAAGAALAPPAAVGGTATATAGPAATPGAGTAGMLLPVRQGKGGALVDVPASGAVLYLPLRPLPDLLPNADTLRYDDRRLAALSRETAERCRKLNAGGAPLPEIHEAERLRASVSRAAEALAGARLRLAVAPGTRLVPFTTTAVRIALHGPDSTAGTAPALTAARAADPGAVAVLPAPLRAPGEWEYLVTVNNRRNVEHTVTLLAEAEVKSGGETFFLSDQVTVPCDMPLLVALKERGRLLVAGRSAPVTVEVRNVAPTPVQVRCRPLLPPGWTCAPASPAPAQVGPAGLEPATGAVSFTLTAPPDAKPGTLLLPVETTYADAPDAPVVSQFACDILPRLTPVSEAGPFTPTDKPARVRGKGRALVYAAADETIRLKIANVRVTTYADTLGYRLLDPDLKEVAKASVKVDEAAAVTVKAAVAGTYFLEVDAKGGSCTVEAENRPLVLEMSPAQPLHVIFQMPTLYFWVPDDAKQFTLHVECGGETEPIDLALFEPAGREALKESGVLLGRDLVVTVPADSRGKPWKLVVRPPAAR